MYYVLYNNERSSPLFMVLCNYLVLYISTFLIFAVFSHSGQHLLEHMRLFMGL